MGNGALPNGPSYRAHTRLYPKCPRDLSQLAKSIIDKRRNKPKRSGLHPFKRPRAPDKGGSNQAVRLTTEQRGQKSLGWPPTRCCWQRVRGFDRLHDAAIYAFEDHLQGAWRCAGSTRASQMNYGTRSSSGLTASAIPLLGAPKESAARWVGRKLRQVYTRLCDINDRQGCHGNRDQDF
jgi:hypothetical protein